MFICVASYFRGLPDGRRALPRHGQKRMKRARETKKREGEPRASRLVSWQNVDTGLTLRCRCTLGGGRTWRCETGPQRFPRSPRNRCWVWTRAEGFQTRAPGSRKTEGTAGCRPRRQSQRVSPAPVSPPARPPAGRPSVRARERALERYSFETRN